jgi:hypothetical protein
MPRLTVVSVILSGVIAAFGLEHVVSETAERIEHIGPDIGVVFEIKDEHNFERVYIYNVDKEGREYDLAPDEQARTGGKVVQTWRLQDYRSMKIFLTTPPWSYLGKRLLPSPDAPSHSFWTRMAISSANPICSAANKTLTIS